VTSVRTPKRGIPCRPISPTPLPHQIAALFQSSVVVIDGDTPPSLLRCRRSFLTLQPPPVCASGCLFFWPVPCIATPAPSACVAYRSCTSLWLTSTPLGQLALCYCPPPVGSFPYAAAAYYLPLSAAVRSSPRSLCLGHQEAVRQRYVESSKPPHLPRPSSAVTIAALSATVFTLIIPSTSPLCPTA
jgi:hypothetical protein